MVKIIDFKSAEKVQLEIWIKTYFNAEEDLSEFDVRRNTIGWFIGKKNDCIGYFFTNFNYQRNMKISADFYKEAGFDIEDVSIDSERGLAGFKWRLPEDRNEQSYVRNQDDKM